MDARPLPVESATDDEDAASVALFRSLADGGRHRFADLARAIAGAANRSTLAGISAGLAELESLGLAMHLDSDGVQAGAFIALDRASIERHLEREGSSPRHWEVRVAFALDSTNTALLRDVRTHGRPNGPILLAAEIQHAGRGRLGRDWASAPGSSVTVSFALRIDRGIGRLDGLTLACGLAVQRVVAAYGAPARLKWPNDLLVDGRKLAGILVEAHGSGSGTTLVVGIGINIGINIGFASPQPARPSALQTAHLQESRTGPIDRNLLIAQLALSLEEHLALFEAQGFDAFAACWNAEDAFHDRWVALHSAPSPPLVGIARGVDASGALLLDVDGERRRVIAGDVSLRPVPGQEAA